MLETVIDLATGAVFERELVPSDEPPAPLPLVPASVSAFQAKAVLLANGLLDQAEAAVAGADAFVQLAWREARELERDSPTIAALAGALGIDAARLDQLFIAAAEIRA